jgi:hypothetical protein
MKRAQQNERGEEGRCDILSGVVEEEEEEEEGFGGGEERRGGGGVNKEW